MAVDNTLYDRPGDLWWDEHEQFSMLSTMVNPARFGFFRSVLSERFRSDFNSRRALDVGCGGGLLAEEFARLGLKLAGIDPSYPSLLTAQSHRVHSNLEIRYIAAAGELLPFRNDRYDVVFCCDVLEHVPKPGIVLAEISRVLKPGGFFLYDTINRTWWSKLAVIKAFQEWNWISCAPAHLHDWANFIKPVELWEMMACVRLQNCLTMGMKPASNVFTLLRHMRRRKRGEISYAELGRRMRMTISEDLSLAYLGYAVKSADA